MKYTITQSVVAFFGIMLLFVLLVPFTTGAISRIQSREAAATERTVGAGDPTGTGGSNGGGSGQDGSESVDNNADPGAAQELIDDMDLGDEDDEGPLVLTDSDTADAEEQVANVDAANPGFSFVTILSAILTRFRSH